MRIYNVVLVGSMGFKQVIHIGQTKPSAIRIAKRLAQENRGSKYCVEEELN